MYRVIDTKKETTKLHNALEEWAEEDVIFYLNYANAYSAFSYEELLQQVTMWKDNEELTDLELTEDNIQIWTYKNQEYYRLTFTSEKMPRVSRAELALGNRLVMGLTYIVKKSDYEKYHDELFSKLRGEPAPKPKKNKKKNKKNIIRGQRGAPVKKLKVVAPLCHPKYKSRVIAMDTERQTPMQQPPRIILD
tara:strand:- start:56 stop:631 length:576 start_codon:yes stop_codon:yes gene_type:complete